MPQRPSKKPRVQPGKKPSPAQGSEGSDQASIQRRSAQLAKAIIGKFQGRKSV